MDIKTYLAQAPRGEQKRINNELGRPGYIWRKANGGRNFNLVDALKLERRTRGAVRREEILPNFDWSLLERTEGSSSTGKR